MPVCHPHSHSILKHTQNCKREWGKKIYLNKFVSSLNFNFQSTVPKSIDVMATSSKKKSLMCKILS